MFRTAFAALAMLILVVPVFAQQQGDKSFSVMASNLSLTHSEGAGTDLGGGIAFGLNYWLTTRWSAELGAAIERSSYPGPVVDDPIARIRTNTYPVDVLAQYHIATGQSRWKPYAGLGAHYVGVPDGAIDRNYDKLTAQVNAGTYFMFRPRLGLRLDTKILLRGVDAPWDDTFRASAGLSWRF